MFAWAVAASLLLGVLGFEFLLFRYVGANRSRTASADRESTTAAGESVSPGVRSTGRSPGGGRPGSSAATDGVVVSCPQCGAANQDHPTVWFCRQCVSRIH